jgi:phosphate transport system substrate-binding protein
MIHFFKKNHAIQLIILFIIFSINNLSAAEDIKITANSQIDKKEESPEKIEQKKIEAEKKLLDEQKKISDETYKKELGQDNVIQNQQLINNKIMRVAINPILLPMMNKFSDHFYGQLSFTKLDSPFNNESDGIEKFCYNANAINALIITRKLNEYEKNFCKSKSKSNIEEIQIGHYSLMIIGHKEKKDINLSTRILFQALARRFSTLDDFLINKNFKWSDINRLMPNEQIKFYGQFIDSPSYSYLVNRVILNSCISDKYTQEQFKDMKLLNEQCRGIRTDGVYLGDSSDGRLALQKIFSEKNSYSIVQYNVYQNNKSTLSLHSFNGVIPTLENIRNGTYGLSFPIYIYVKKNKIEESNLLKSFLMDIKNKNAVGQSGYLKDHGLITLDMTD